MSDARNQQIDHNRARDPITLATAVYERFRSRLPLNKYLLELVQHKDEPAVEDLLEQTGLKRPLTKIILDRPTSPLDPTLDDRLPSANLAMFHHCLRPGRSPGILSRDAITIIPPDAIIVAPTTDPFLAAAVSMREGMIRYNPALARLIDRRNTRFIDTGYESFDPELANSLHVPHPSTPTCGRMKILKRGDWAYRRFELTAQRQLVIHLYYGIKEEFQDVLR